MKRAFVVCMDGSCTSDNSLNIRCRGYAQHIHNHLSSVPECRAELIELPHDRGRLSAADVSQPCSIIVFLHGHECYKNLCKHIYAQARLDDQRLDDQHSLCACFAVDERKPVIRALQAASMPFFCDAKILGATVCYGASHLGTVLTGPGSADYFVGYKDVFTHVDVAIVMSEDNVFDPYVEIFEVASLWVVQPEVPADVVKKQMHQAYSIGAKFFTSKGLDFFGARLVYLALRRNARALRALSSGTVGQEPTGPHFSQANKASQSRKGVDDS